uniref:Uncharacterized protein n=1 Tax=viral metagenome TaxID=1070528 RepID=A0A6C0H8I0_9ZZZZ
MVEVGAAHLTNSPEASNGWWISAPFTSVVTAIKDALQAERAELTTATIKMTEAAAQMERTTEYMKRSDTALGHVEVRDGKTEEQQQQIHNLARIIDTMMKKINELVEYQTKTTDICVEKMEEQEHHVQVQTETTRMCVEKSEEHEQQINDQKETIGAVVKKITELEQQIKDQKNGAVAKKITELEQQIKDQKNDAVAKKITELEQQIKDQEKTFSAFAKKINTSGTEQNKMNTMILEKLTEKQTNIDKIAELQSQIEFLVKNQAKQEATISQLLLKLSQCDEEHDELLKEKKRNKELEERLKIQKNPYNVWKLKLTRCGRAQSSITKTLCSVRKKWTQMRNNSQSWKHLLT